MWSIAKTYRYYVKHPEMIFAELAEAFLKTILICGFVIGLARIILVSVPEIVKDNIMDNPNTFSIFIVLLLSISFGFVVLTTQFYRFRVEHEARRMNVIEQEEGL